MRLPVRGNVRIALFALLVLGSLSLKAAAGAPRDRLIESDPRHFERAVTGVLSAQHFVTNLRAYPYRPTLVLAARGNCRLAVRDATFGAALAPTFAEDARSVGPVRYFYRGDSFERPPGMILRFGRLEFEILGRLGFDRPMPVLVALAASPDCGRDRFGLADLHLES
jgi:hypothetical protein